MLDLCRLIFRMVVDLFRSRAELEAEILVLRQQINVMQRASPRRAPFSLYDRLILGCVCRLFPKVYDALAIVRPDTVIRWHRAGFRSYWRWKSRHRCGRPTVPLEIRRLIRQMSIARTHYLPPDPGRTALPICPDLICDNDRMPENVLVKERAIATAGLANDVDAVNQYAAVM